MRALLVLPLLLCGCNTTPETGSPVSDVILTASPVPAEAGGELTLTLRNEAGSVVAYNLCTSTLERREGEAWRSVPEDRVCTMELRLLEPASQAAFTLRLPGDLADGTYRYVASVDRGASGNTELVATDPFQVRP